MLSQFQFLPRHRVGRLRPGSQYDRKAPTNRVLRKNNMPHKFNWEKIMTIMIKDRLNDSGYRKNQDEAQTYMCRFQFKNIGGKKTYDEKQRPGKRSIVTY